MTPVGDRAARALWDAFEFSPREIFGVLTAALLANLLGGLAVIKLNTLFFLDMMGTAIAAIALGPWPAAPGSWTVLIGRPLQSQSRRAGACPPPGSSPAGAREVEHARP